MREYLIVDDKKNNEYIQDNIKYQLRFCFPQIKDVIFVDSGVKVIYEGNLVESKVKEYMNKIEEKFSKLNFKVSKKKLYDSKTDAVKKFSNEDRKIFTGLGEELIEKLLSYDNTNDFVINSVVEVGEGLNVYTGQWILFHDLLEDLISKYLKLKFGAIELKVPSLISKEIIEKSGYFETGSQHLSFIAPISNDPDAYDELIKDKYCRFKGEIDFKESYKYFRSPNYVLNPALCIHCYPIFKNKIFEKDKTIALTIKGSCFRDESGNLNNKDRLNEFTMQECVFFGNHENLIKIHQTLVDFIIYIGYLFGLDYTIETSNDIFFDENATQQLFSQIMSDNKIEFTVNCESISKSVAVASVNKHHSHFSDRFDMKDETGELINTMCLAFGFDRLILVIQEAVSGDLKKLIDNIKLKCIKLLD